MRYTKRMYFKDRSEAGQKLAVELERYRYENTAVLCLSEGSVLVGQQIASQLHSVMMLMLLTSEIMMPGSSEESFGVLDQAGNMTFNDELSEGEASEYAQEYRGYLDQEKINRRHDMNLILGQFGPVDLQSLRGYNVILVSDGLHNGTLMEAAVNYLKPAILERIIGVTPIASVTAVDRLHILVDEIHVLDVRENYLDTDHYYEDNTIPEHEAVQQILARITENWT